MATGRPRPKDSCYKKNILENQHHIEYQRQLFKVGYSAIFFVRKTIYLD